MNDYQYGEYLNEKYEGNKSRLIKTLSISTIGAISAYTFVIFASNYVDKTDEITWDDINKSYVGLVKYDDDYINCLLKNEKNGLYTDMIDCNIYRKNDILEKYRAVPYFVQTGNVKDKYTKEEVRSIIKSFKIGSKEYRYSNDYVKIKK